MKNRNSVFLYIDNYAGMLIPTDEVYKNQAEIKNTQYRNQFHLRVKNSFVFIIVIIAHISVWLCWADSTPKASTATTTLQISFVSPHESNAVPPSLVKPVEPPAAPVIDKKKMITSQQSEVVTKKVVRKNLRIKKLVIEKPEKKPSSKNNNQDIIRSAIDEKNSKQQKEETVEPAKFNADYLNNPKPDYPDVSIRLHEEGIVILKVAVSASGHADTIMIEKSSGFDRLDVAAKKAVNGWIFIPAKKGDANIFSWVLVPVKFKLEDE